MPASSSARVPGFDRLPLSFPLLLVYAAGLMPGVLLPLKCRADASAEAEMQRQGMGGSSMWESQTGSLLVDYYETFLRERDLDQFREQVTARYTEGTLGRVLISSPSVAARRAAVLALGVVGSFDQSNAFLGRALRDSDAIVRTMAESALWAIWFRADSPENNQTLDQVRLLIGNHHLDEAVNAATRLIARTPRFAEAYNQRAIALFIQGRFAESARIASACSSSILTTSARCRGWRSARSSSNNPTRHCVRSVSQRSSSRTVNRFAIISRFLKRRSRRTGRDKQCDLIVVQWGRNRPLASRRIGQAMHGWSPEGRAVGVCECGNDLRKRPKVKVNHAANGMMVIVEISIGGQ